MEQKEIIQFILDERRRQGYTIETFREKAGTSLAHLRGFLSDVPSSEKRVTIGIATALKALNALGYTLDVKSIAEDKWEPINTFPPSLFLFDRAESKETIKREGVHPRIDLYESPATAIKFMSGPSDLYEVETKHLLRLHITDIERHPYGIRYSYSDSLKPEMLTYLVRVEK